MPDRLSRIWRDELGEAEIHDLHHAVGSHDDIFRFDVAVHDTRAMRGLERARHLHRDVHSFDRRNRGGQPRAEGLPVNELGGNVVTPIRAAHVVDCRNVRVVQRRRRSRLLCEAGCQRKGLARCPVKNLERELASKTRIVGEVHVAHRTRPQRLDDTIRSDVLACRTDARSRIEHVGRDLRDRHIEQAAPVVGREQRLDLQAERLVAETGRRDERGPPGHRLRECT